MKVIQEKLRVKIYESLTSNLASWSINHNCTRSCVNDLLAVLRNNGFNLPKDSRTLLGTVRDVFCIKKCGGDYIYFGIEQNVISVITNGKIIIV